MATMDPALIRFAGAVPFLWIPPGLIGNGLLIYDPVPVTAFVAAVPVGVQAITTESDALAVRDPEEFRQRWLDDDLPRNPMYLPNWVVPDWV